MRSEKKISKTEFPAFSMSFPPLDAPNEINEAQEMPIEESKGFDERAEGMMRRRARRRCWNAFRAVALSLCSEDSETSNISGENLPKKSVIALNVISDSSCEEKRERTIYITIITIIINTIESTEEFCLDSTVK